MASQPTDNRYAGNLERLTKEIARCKACSHLLEPRPIVRLSTTARVLIIGQAPGSRVHATGIPWNDVSGERLRTWLALTPDQFYDTRHIAIMPMGFCYPGKGKHGDLPPRPECQQLWHKKVLAALPAIETTLLIGHYAQRAYLNNALPTLTANVKNWRRWFPRFIPLPHPSPRNQRWLRQRPWFEEEVVPTVTAEVHRLLFQKSH